MPVKQSNRQRLRSGLLGPLGEEVTDMLMEEIDQAALRDHVDERFDEQRRYVDERFRRVDERCEAIEKRLERIEDRLTDLAKAVIDAARPGNAVVYAVCGSTAVVALAALLQGLLNA